MGLNSPITGRRWFNAKCLLIPGPRAIIPFVGQRQGREEVARFFAKLSENSWAKETIQRRSQMAKSKSAANENEISRDRLAELLNEDLSREYQAIIAYVVYSQVLSGAQYMDIAAQLEIHAKQELDHALILSRQIDYLGKMPAVTTKPVRTSENAEEMLRFDLENENETIRNYRERVRQCEALGEYAMAEQIRQILVQEQDHQIDLATALGEEVPDLSGWPQGRTLGQAPVAQFAQKGA